MKEDAAQREQQPGTVAVAADPVDVAATHGSKAFLRAVVISRATYKVRLHSCDVGAECDSVKLKPVKLELLLSCRVYSKEYTIDARGFSNLLVTGNKLYKCL